MNGAVYKTLGNDRRKSTMKITTEFVTTFDHDGNTHAVKFLPNDAVAGGGVEARIGVEPFVSRFGRWDDGWYSMNNSEKLPEEICKALDEALAQAPKPTLEERVEAIERKLGL